MKNRSNNTIELKYIFGGIGMICFLLLILFLAKYGWVIWWILEGLLGNNEIPHA
jgi:hypothetical protein